MSSLAPKILRANAGTGKTFALSNRYLSLLLKDEKPERILATTFTRKAAGEIQARIFTRLAAAAASDDGAAKLGKELEMNLSRARATELLRSLVDSQHRLAIGTLDSLCQRLLRMYAIEAGFPQGFRPASEEENANFITAAVVALIGRSKTEKLYVLLRLLAGGRDRYGIHRALERALKENHQLYLRSAPEAWSSIEPLPECSPSEIEAALSAVSALSPLMNKDGKKPNGHIVRALVEDVERARAGDWEKFLATGLVKPIFNRTLEFQRNQIPVEYQQAYSPLVAHASAVILNERIQRSRALFSLLSEYDAGYWAERRAQGILDFGDIKQLLASAAIFGNLEELYYRLDSEFPHVLLDEFQDTSLVEWDIVRPIAAEILSKASGNENTFFCVGDVKQAIYGWRGGVAEIFDSITEEWPHLIVENLPLSYRSAPEIVGFVNTVFQGIERNSMLQEYVEVAARWSRGFTEHGAAKRDLPGFVSVEAVTGAEKDDGLLISRTVELVQSIQAANPSATIGILTRRNADIRSVVRALLAAGIQASEEGGVTLADSKGILAFVALFNLTDHPGDTIAQYHVEHSPLAAALAPILGSTYLRGVSIDPLREVLLTEGFGKTILRLLHGSLSAWSEGEAERIRQLAELGFSFDPRRGIRTREFVHLIERKKVEQSRPSAVRVMTYHRSKGLEFDAVILPFQHQSWFRRGGGASAVLGMYSSPVKPPDRVVPFLSSSLAPIHPQIEAAAKQAKEGAVLDALNLLYVALTRPRRALYLLVPALAASPKKSEPALSGATILRDALSLASDARAGELYRIGSSDWFSTVQANSGQSGAAGGELPNRIELLSPQKGIRSTTFLTASGSEGAEGATVATSLFSSTGGLDEGSLFHALFESVGWLDEGAAVEAASLLHKYRVSESDARRLQRECESMLRHSEIESYLQRGRFEAEGFVAELYRELPFAESEGDTLVRGVMDRVVAQSREGKVHAVTVIDYKTDRVTEEEILARAEFYRPQLAVYEKAAARIFGVPPKAVQSVVLFMRPGKAVQL